MRAVVPSHVVVPGDGTAEVIALHGRVGVGDAAVLALVDTLVRRPLPVRSERLPVRRPGPVGEEASSLAWPARPCCPHRAAAGPCVLPPHERGTCLPAPAQQKWGTR